MSDDIGKDVHLHPLRLYHYLHEKIYARLDQVVHPNNVLNDINEAYCHAPAEPFHKCYYDYARIIMSAYVYTTAIPEVVNYATAAPNLDGIKSLKGGCCMVLIDGHHWLCSVEILRIKDEV